MESGDCKDIANFVIYIFQHKRASLAPDIFKKAEENAQTGAADIFKSAAFDHNIFIRIFMQGSKLFFAFCGLKSIEASFERSDDFAGFFS